MRIRNILMSGTAATVLVGSAIAISGTANAATIKCTNTTTHHHSVTSLGTVSDYTTHKWGCGKNYTETEVGTTQSVTGAHSSFNWTKVETFPCWTKVEHRTSVSKKGTVTHTVTHSGNC
jgi:hypothetical protein